MKCCRIWHLYRKCSSANGSRALNIRCFLKTSLRYAIRTFIRTFQVTLMTVPTQHKDMTRLCVGCGICLGICPVNAIDLKANKGVMTVDFDYSRCTKCDMCIKACPALSNLYKGSSKFPYTVGRIERIFFGYSTDNSIRYHAASGGVITSLIIYMLKSKTVDKVLLVRMEGFTVKALLTGNKDDVLSAQGSIYFKTFSLRVLKKILSHLRKGKRVCIVGLPCQISMLKKVLKRFEDKLYFIGLICSHVSELWYMDYMLERYLPKNAKPLAIGSRKDGWPGGIKVLFELKNRNPQELTVPLSGLITSLNISAPLGCLICTDHLASMADVVAGDAWHPKFIGKNSSGVSIVVVRSVRGIELVESAIRDGALYTEEARLRDLLITQGRNIIEGSQYGPFKQKLLQYRISAIRELKEVNKSIIALLTIINHCMSKYKTMRRLLDTLAAEKLLSTILWFLSQHESMTLKEAIEALENRTS